MEIDAYIGGGKGLSEGVDCWGIVSLKGLLLKAGKEGYQGWYIGMGAYDKSFESDNDVLIHSGAMF